MENEQPSKGPIRRHPAIAQYSRDHHFGLMLCFKIRKGLRNNVPADRIRNYVAYCYREDLSEHFRLEEESLLPAFQADDPLVARTIDEHKQIRTLIDQMNVHNEAGLLKTFADVLEKHIRFEERVLFMKLQTMLSDAELWELEKAHPPGSCNIDVDWKDKFWI
jgi:hemerythrin-like domain-containing protein